MLYYAMVVDWHKVFDIRDCGYDCTFRLFNTDSTSLGDTYLDTEKSFVNLSRHETFTEILDTREHEDIHVALKREDLNEDVEHVIIRKILWVKSGMWE